MKKKMIVLFSVLVLVVTGCGLKDYISKTYPLENVVYGEDGYDSKIYRAQDKTVKQVMKDLIENKKPVEKSKLKDDRVFLVYDEYLVQIMKDADKKEDALIEVSSKEFVAHNYNHSLLQTYLIASIVDDMYDIDKKKRHYGGTYYSGYVSTNGQYTKYGGNSGSVRTGSSNGTSVRGGGPGTGK